MTMSEFLNEEGKREGKTGGEVLEEIFDDIDKDDQRQEQHYKDNPDEFLAPLKIASEYEEDNPIPVKVLEVVDVKQSTSLSSSKTHATLLVECQDGKTRTAEFHHEYWSGSFYEPPEEDEWVEWKEENEKESAKSE
jgi:hypothetical protein